jgi:aspartate/methionine/tyrosine aminotransferase
MNGPNNQDLIQALSRAGSYLDGGASHVLQEAALPLLEPELVRSEMKALQQHFVKKRDFVVQSYGLVRLDI